jgi:hypothetical protein
MILTFQQEILSLQSINSVPSSIKSFSTTSLPYSKKKKSSRDQQLHPSLPYGILEIEGNSSYRK